MIFFNPGVAKIIMRVRTSVTEKIALKEYTFRGVIHVKKSGRYARIINQTVFEQSGHDEASGVTPIPISY